MGIAANYRQFALEQRKQADRTVLPLARERHLAAAEKWDILAYDAETYDPAWLAQIRSSMAFIA